MMISFIKLIRFHCRCLSPTEKQTTTADDGNGDSLLQDGADRHQTSALMHVNEW